jgi:hypothetical protein
MQPGHSWALFSLIVRQIDVLKKVFFLLSLPIRFKIFRQWHDLLYALGNAPLRSVCTVFLNPAGITPMSLSFIFEQFRSLWISHRQTEDSGRVADKIARQCLEKVVKRINLTSGPLAEGEIRGYLRAVATSTINEALEKISAERPLSKGCAAIVRSVAFDLLEQMVIEKLRNPSRVLASKSAAA